MRSVQIYIEGERDSNDYTEIELFNDEKISINLSVQNIQDISKVFTDFSQSFTVPASSVNNAVFKHFYENAVDLDPTLIDQRLRRKAFIEIDRTPFRSGKIQLEKANLKDGQAESYTITFYGDLITLKDLFGDDKLSDLDYTAYDHSYTGAEIYNRIITPNSTTDYDIRYPLITSERLWSYGDATSTDISTSGGRIDYTELFPAVKVARVFDAIETKYGVNFNGLFLTDKRFTNLFLWCKNREESVTYTDSTLLDITSSNNSSVFKIVEDYVTVTSYTQVNQKVTSQLSLRVFNVSNVNVNWFIDVYSNGTLQRTVTGSGNQTVFITGGNNSNIQCYFYSDGVLTCDTQYIYTRRTVDFTQGGQQSGATITNETFNSVNASLNLAMTSNIKNRMPDITVSDFFTGILKQFNLTCYALSVNTFEIEPLDYWYQKGGVVDVTKYIDIDSIDVSKVPLYKNVSFEFEKSNSFNNISYFNALRKEYGNLKNSFDFDGPDFNIKVPFENLRFEKFVGDEITVGYSLGEAPEYKSYVPKATILYMYELQSCTGFKFYDSSTEQTITNYMPFGQDLLSNGYNYSLNFGVETSTLLESAVNNSIYEVYYKNYLENLFLYKNRLTNIKAFFPTSLITSLRLNDRLVIRDKRYVINSIGSNLTTGEVNLELINDFRLIANENIPTVGGGSGTITIPVLVPSSATQVDVTTGATGVTFTGATTFTSDSELVVNYSANPNLLFELIAENGDEMITEDLFNRRSEQGEPFLIELNLETTYTNGDIDNSSLYIIQEAEW